MSLHDSRATLRLLAAPFDLGGFEGYYGSLEDKLSGEFSIGNATGTAKLSIAGTATYACFSAFGAPQLSVAACTKHGDAYAATHVFVPIDLSVVDTGTFKIKAKPGEVIAGDRELRKMSGDLTVTVDAPGVTGDPPFGSITITNAPAKYVSLPHDHDG